MKPQLVIAFTALFVLGCPQIIRAQEKPKPTAGYIIPTVNKPLPPTLTEITKQESNIVGPLEFTLRTRTSPFDPRQPNNYNLKTRIIIPTTPISFAPEFGSCIKRKNAPQEFINCRRYGASLKVDFNKKLKKLNPGGKFGKFK